MEPCTDCNFIKCSNYSIHKNSDSYSFLHVKITDETLFYSEVCKCLLNEVLLLRYAENKKAIKFTPSRKNYVRLYKLLDLFIDDDLVETEMPSVNVSDGELEKILNEEFETYYDDKGKLKIQLTKMGRIGEYICHNILSHYFNFSCIIPKVCFTTDKNMSVYGIDELFYSKSNNMLLFGESKLTTCLNNGIYQALKSIKEYEKEIRDEYKLVLSQNLISLVLPSAYKNQTDLCLSFDEFKDAVGLSKIGVPVCITHGTEIDHDEILSALNKISGPSLFGLDTVYYAISFPIIDKNKFIARLTAEIKIKRASYESSE